MHIATTKRPSARRKFNISLKTSFPRSLPLCRESHCFAGDSFIFFYSFFLSTFFLRIQHSVVESLAPPTRVTCDRGMRVEYIMYLITEKSGAPDQFSHLSSGISNSTNSSTLYHSISRLNKYFYISSNFLQGFSVRSAIFLWNLFFFFYLGVFCVGTYWKNFSSVIISENLEGPFIDVRKKNISCTKTTLIVVVLFGSRI